MVLPLRKMKVLSLFDGISVAQQALKELGIECEYYASEIDRYAISITQKNFPHTIQLGDVKNISYNNLNIEFDILIGGSPCQDLSIAKKNREGLKGSRSILFWDYVRIFKELKPRYFVLENVNSMSKESIRIITETLKVEPIMINAALVSAQNRKRLFWTNIPNITQPTDRGILLKDILEDNLITDRQKSRTIRVSGIGSGINDKHNWQEIKSYCLPATYKENIKSLEKRKKKGLMIRIGQLSKGGQGDRVYSPEGKSISLSANGGGWGAKTGLYLIDHYNKKIKTDNKAKTLGTNPQCKSAVAGQSITDMQSFVRKLTPIECERLQSLPDNYTIKGINEKGEEVIISNT